MTDTVFQDRKLADTEHRIIGIDSLQSYFINLWNLLCRIEVTSEDGTRLKHDRAVDSLLAHIVDAHDGGGNLIFVGNGGSGAIASHMAADFVKNGGIRALALNDPPTLTCMANDLGYEHVFSKQIEMHARNGDVLVAISSSGRSSNILAAVKAARAAQCVVVTMSGFDADNPLRSTGLWNFYVPCGQYGPVEIAHLTLCHAMLDRLCSSKEKAPS